MADKTRKIRFETMEGILNTVMGAALGSVVLGPGSSQKSLLTDDFPAIGRIALSVSMLALLAACVFCVVAFAQKVGRSVSSQERIPLASIIGFFAFAFFASWVSPFPLSLELNERLFCLIVAWLPLYCMIGRTCRAEA